MPFVKLTVLFTIAAKLLARLNLAQATSRLWPPSLLTYGVMMSGVLVTASALLYAQWIAPPPHVAAAECDIPPATATPRFPWRFQPDPDDVGLTQGWFAPAFNDAAWDESDPGAPWEERGYLDLDGAAWYRATFDIPATWPTAYLGTVGIDDTGQLWINGRETTPDTLVPLPPGERVQITYRIDDEGGFGGIKKSVRVGISPAAALLPDDYVRWLAVQNPDWPMPPWIDGSYHAWTFTGAPYAADEAIISAGAAVVPWAKAPLVELWLHDEDGRFHTPDVTFSLLDDVLPMPQANGRLADLSFASTFFTAFDGEGTYWQTALANETDTPWRGTLYVVVRPLAITAGLRPIYSAGFSPNGNFWLNGSHFMTAMPQPTAATTGLWQNVSETLVNGDPPIASALDCAPDGNGMAVFAYDLTLDSAATWDLTLAFPTTPGQSAPNPRRAAAAMESTRAAWQTEIGAPDLTLPDGFVMNGYKASVGYLLIALDPDGPHPGPLEHDALWVRDAAFIGETLLSLGYTEAVAAFIPSLFAYQRHDGYVPAIIEPGHGPRPDVEWDAQGQLIFLIAEYYRYTGDRNKLAEWYPHIHKAAAFLVSLRQQTAANPPPTRGILPPSKSAEDLGPEEWHHYWDDFWGIIGLLDGAYVAAELGDDASAQWMLAEAEALRDALRDSIVAVMGPEPAYIPNGPEDITSSAMARGSANSLYPLTVFERTDPLILRSFDEYHARWIEPQGGGYKHIYGQLWPYGGLGLARDYVRLGRHDVLHQILGWTLTNQTLPGTFAWAEQVNPLTGGFSGGDMPHAWAAASYVTLIREMLLLRDEKTLELFAGVPGSWLSEGQVVGLTGAPTMFGAVTAVTTSTLSITDDSWQGTLTLTISGAQPPGGYRWRLPHAPTGVSGPPGTHFQQGWLLIPASGGEVVLTYGDQDK